MSRAPGMYLDASRFPVVVNTQVGQVTDEQVEAYFRDLETLAKHGRPFAIVLDLREGVPFNSKQRKMLADWMDAHPVHMGRLRGIAFVHDSMVMRGAMQAVFWLKPPGYAYTIVREKDAAYAWAFARTQQSEGARAG